MQQTGAAPDAPRDQLPAEGPLSDEQRAQLFGWLVAMKEAMAAPADNPTAAPAPGPDARLPWPEAPLLQSPMQQPPPPWSAQQQLLPQVLRQAQQASEYKQTQQPERQPWAFEAPAPPAGGGSNLLSMLSAGLPNLLSPVTPAAGAPASLPAPLFLGSPAATPLSGGGAGLFGGDTSFLNGGLNSGRMPGLHAPGLGSGGISGGPGGAGVGSSGDLADGADGQAGLAFQAALQQVPLWSAADVLPATLGAGGLLDLAPGTVLPPPPPMPQPLNAGGDGPAVFRSRAPRRKRARIMRDGQLTMIVYGANEALLWTRRVAAFQHNMRGVLGDRRLTFNWGGSVLDSVVGVFLTQNVADHLSSRAYMELASRFPVRRRQQLMEGADSAASGPADIASEGGGAADGGWTAQEDSVDWEAVRTASHADLSDAIKCRGMQFRLADQIIRFLNQIREHNIARIRKQRRAERKTERAAVQELMGQILDAVGASEARHQATGDAMPAGAADAAEGDGPSAGAASAGRRRRGHISLEYEEESAAAGAGARAAGVAGKPGKPGPLPKLPPGSAREEEEAEEVPAHELLSLEWLRDAPDSVARDYLMNIDGLGRKSVGCIMLLTLNKKEFPVDTNVGRICARLGWLPLEAEQKVEDLDDYAPEPEVHAYLHSRLLGFDVETLYELHFQMITLGKVFCNKQQPNCSACPMNEACEYAQNNGPSLHGRKRVRQPDPVLGDGMAEPLLPEHDARRFGTGGGGGMRDFIVADDKRGRRRRRGSDDDDLSISGGSDSGSSEDEDTSSGEDTTSEEEEEEGEGGPPPMTRRRAAEAEAAGPQPTLRQVFAAAMAEANAKHARVHWKTLERLTRMHQQELQAALQAQTLDLDDLLAAVPRRPRTPGRCATTRFERARKLKRSRELAQLLQGAEEEEREALLDLGAKGRVGEWRSRRRGRGAAEAAEAVAGSGPMAEPRQGAAAWGGPPSRASPAPEPEEPSQEGEEAMEADSSDYEPSPSPEADRRCARSIAAAAAAGGEACATPATRARDPATAPGEDGHEPAGGSEASVAAGEPEQPTTEQHILGAAPPRQLATGPRAGVAAGSPSDAAVLEQLAGRGTNLSDLFAAAASEFIASHQKQPQQGQPGAGLLPSAAGQPMGLARPQSAPNPAAPACLPAPHASVTAAAIAQLAGQGMQFNAVLAAAASDIIAKHQQQQQQLLQEQTQQQAQQPTAATAETPPVRAVLQPATSDTAAVEDPRKLQHACHAQQQPSTPLGSVVPWLAGSAEEPTSQQQGDSDSATATATGVGQRADEEAEAEPASPPATAGACLPAAAAAVLAGDSDAPVSEAATAPLEAEMAEAGTDSTACDPLTPSEPADIAPLAAAAPAVAVHICPAGDAAAECERLEACGQRLATAQRALLVAEGKGPGTDLSPFHCRLVEVSLDILGLEAALTADTALAVMSVAKRAYRQLSMLVHPDRCSLPEAEDAFAAVSQAMEILKDQADALLRGPPAPAGAAGLGGAQPEGNGGAAGAAEAGEAEDGAVVRFVDVEELLQQVVWNQNRLAVPAVLVPPDELRRRGLLHPGYQQQFAEGSSLAVEPIVFLPVASIPTLKKRRRLLAAPPALRAAVVGDSSAANAGAMAAALDPSLRAQLAAQQASQGSGEVHQPADCLGEQLCPPVLPLKPEQKDSPPASPPAAQPGLGEGIAPLYAQPASAYGAASEPLEPEAGADCQPAQQEQQERPEQPGAACGGDLVEGLLLVSARAALCGRFPLNGTYFQVNEVFADDATTQEPIQLPRALLDACRPCSLHFGHSIHFMCKGMSQAEVAHMFSHGFVCFRSFRADTGAPILLPEFLQPSIPTKSNAAWKNAEQRAAERVAKLARLAGLPLPSEPPPVRWLRVPASPEEAAAAQSALPAVLSPDEQERGATGLEVFLPGLPDDPLAGLGSPAKRKWGASKKWGGPGGGEGREGEEGDSDDGLPRRAGAQPHSQEARDAKSGKGRRRLFLHPIIRSRERCGTCPACRNRHWKKACMTRRAEQEAGAA